MFNELIRFLFKCVFYIFGVFSTIITGPLFRFLELLFPHFNDYESIFYHFIDTSLVPGLSFAREVFFNVTGFPRGLFLGLVTLFMARLAYRIAVIPIRFIVNMFLFFKGHASD